MSNQDYMLPPMYNMSTDVLTVQSANLNNLMLSQNDGNVNLSVINLNSNRQRKPNNSMAQENSRTPLGTLNELCSKAKVTPVFQFTAEGPVHNCRFECHVSVNKDGMGTEAKAIGVGKNKKDAKHDAAKKLLLGMDARLVEQFDGRFNQREEAPQLPECDPEPPGNPVGELNELCLRAKRVVPEYEDENQDGAPHERVFSVTCKIGSKLFEMEQQEALVTNNSVRDCPMDFTPPPTPAVEGFLDFAYTTTTITTNGLEDETHLTNSAVIQSSAQNSVVSGLQPVSDIIRFQHEQMLDRLMQGDAIEAKATLQFIYNDVVRRMNDLDAVVSQQDDESSSTTTTPAPTFSLLSSSDKPATSTVNRKNRRNQKQPRGVKVTMNDIDHLHPKNNKEYQEMINKIKKKGNKFRCPQCQYVGGLKKYVRQHIESAHLANQLRCPGCKNSLSRFSSLVSHVKKIHSGSIYDYNGTLPKKALILKDNEIVVTEPTEDDRDYLYEHWSCEFSSNKETGEPPPHLFSCGYTHLIDGTTTKIRINNIKVVSKTRLVGAPGGGPGRDPEGGGGPGGDPDVSRRDHFGCGHVNLFRQHKFYLKGDTASPTGIYSIERNPNGLRTVPALVKPVLRFELDAAKISRNRDAFKFFEKSIDFIHQTVAPLRDRAGEAGTIWTSWATANVQILVEEAQNSKNFKHRVITTPDVLQYILDTRQRSVTHLANCIEKLL